METYTLAFSKIFPEYHIRKGQDTGFREKVKNSLRQIKKMNSDMEEYVYAFWYFYRSDDTFKWKIHTIRSDYYSWNEKFEKIKRDDAILSLKEVTGSSYIKQRKIKNLSIKDNIGIQKLQFHNSLKYFDIDGKASTFPINLLAFNDGLSFKDWESWFNHYDISKPLAIIHLTEFRYC